MAGVHELDFDSPDETRTPDKTRVDVVRTDGGATAARIAFEPGWKWSECVKPVAGTEKCQVHHVGFIQSGRMHVAHEDGTELELGPGKRLRDHARTRRLGRRRRTLHRIRVRVRAAEEYARE